MTSSLTRRPLWTPLLALLTVLTLWVAGCDSDATPSRLPATDTGEDPPTSTSCSDQDGDGYGTGCSAGLDCDDGDSSVTDACYRCQTPNDGCPCTDEGKSVECGHVTARLGDRVTCAVGERTCTGGLWGQCSTTGMTTQVASRTQLLAVATNPTACTNNPCDPFCKHYDNSTNPAVDSNTTVDTTGVTLVSTNGVGPTAPGSSCGTQTVNAVRNPIGVVTMVQRSRNMTSTTIANVKTALNSFFSASSSAGMVVGMDTYPCVGCNANAPISSPASDTCKPGTDASQCCGFQYTGPSPSPGYLTVPMAVLPGNQTALTTATSAITAVASGYGADSPTLPALQGALSAASQWAGTVANAKPVVLLVTDGLPDGCGTCGGKKGKNTKNKAACRVQEVVTAAEAAYYGTPSITTLVIGITSSGRGDNLKYLDSIARAGSGGKYGAFLVDASTTTNITNAINQIRDEAVGCTFTVPEPSGSNIIDPSTATVTLSGTNIPRVTSPGACGTANGFYYDASVPALTLCPTTCTTARNNLTANIQITYGCQSGCSSGSSRAKPGPLDLLFVIDRSAQMAVELKDTSGNDSGVTAWAAMQMAVRNFTRSPDADGVGMGITYFPKPGAASNGSRCLTCMYCQDGLGGQNCNCSSGVTLFGFCIGTSGTDINLKTPVPWPYCPEPRNAGTRGDCNNDTSPSNPALGAADLSYEYLQGDSGSCVTSDYNIDTSSGGVDIADLPGTGSSPQWQKVFQSIARTIPSSMPGSTPSTPQARILPALNAAVNTTVSRLGTGRKQAVVLVTSGIPAAPASACNSTSTNLVSTATTAYGLGVPVYVIGVGANATASALDPIAAAGAGSSSAKAFIISNTADPSAFITTMNTIRRQAASCDFQLPTLPSGSTLDYTATAVRVTSGSPATEQLLTRITPPTTCGTSQSWQYDNQTTPTELNLCTTPCNTLRTDLNSRVDITYQCVPPGPTYTSGVATFEFDASTACAADELVVWSDLSWQVTAPGDSKVTWQVATGTRSSAGVVSGLSSDVPVKFTRTALSGQTACAGTWTSGGANSCGFTTDTTTVGPAFTPAKPADVYMDTVLANAGLPRNQNYLRLKATLTPTSDTTQTPTITSWDLQVSCKANR